MIVPENPTQADVDALLQECDIHAFLNRVIMNTSHSFWQKAMDIYWPVHFWQLFKTKFQHKLMDPDQLNDTYRYIVESQWPHRLLSLGFVRPKFARAARYWLELSAGGRIVTYPSLDLIYYHGSRYKLHASLEQRNIFHPKHMVLFSFYGKRRCGKNEAWLWLDGTNAFPDVAYDCARLLVKLIRTDCPDIQRIKNRLRDIGRECRRLHTSRNLNEVEPLGYDLRPSFAGDLTAHYNQMEYEYVPRRRV